jgi:hypothetical protein
MGSEAQRTPIYAKRITLGMRLYASAAKLFGSVMIRFTVWQQPDRQGLEC